MLIPVINWREWLGKRGPKVVLISLGAVLGLAGIGIGGYYLWPEPAPKPAPPIDTTTPPEGTDYAASDDFNRLPMDKRLRWIESAMARISSMEGDEFVDHWNSLSEQQHRRIRNSFEAVMREREIRQVNEYFKLSGKDREAYLDERIDEMEEWDSIFHRMRQPQPNRAVKPREGESDEEFKRRQRAVQQARVAKEMDHFMLRQSGDRRAKRVAYFTALQKRRMSKGMRNLFGKKPEKRRTR
jgi:hypothetical protein